MLYFGMVLFLVKDLESYTWLLEHQKLWNPCFRSAYVHISTMHLKRAPQCFIMDEK